MIRILPPPPPPFPLPHRRQSPVGLSGRFPPTRTCGLAPVTAAVFPRAHRRAGKADPPRAAPGPGTTPPGDSDTAVGLFGPAGAGIGSEMRFRRLGGPERGRAHWSSMSNRVLWIQYLDSRRACTLFLLLRRRLLKRLCRRDPHTIWVVTTLTSFLAVCFNTRGHSSKGRIRIATPNSEWSRANSE